MKKLMLAVAIVCAAVAANAATTNWKYSFSGLIGSDNVAETLGSGSVQMYALINGVETALGGAKDFSNGRITANASLFSTELLTVGETYSVWFVATDGDKTYTSTAMNSLALNSDNTQTVAFGAQTGGKWSAAPEPTSGLLLLLGVAGLALKRKRA